MFDRYTDRARRVVALADQEAGLMMHDSVDTGHLLLGLLREGEAVAFRALDALGVTLETAREAVERRQACGDTHPTAAWPFTPRLKKVLELALREALQLGCNYVGTGHLLLGLIRDADNSEGAQALEDCGIGKGHHGFLADVRAKVLELLHGYAGGARQAEAEKSKPALSLEDGGRIAHLFAAYAQAEGLLAKSTREEVAEHAKTFMHGYACGAGTVAGEARAAALLRTET